MRAILAVLFGILVLLLILEYTPISNANASLKRCVIHLDTTKVNSLDGIVHIAVVSFVAISNENPHDTLTEQSFDSVTCTPIGNQHAVLYRTGERTAIVQIPETTRDLMLANPSQTLTLTF